MMSNYQDIDTQLRTAFNFTAEDLETNRNGKLTPQQQAQLEASMIAFWKIAGLIGLVILIGTVGGAFSVATSVNPVMDVDQIPVAFAIVVIITGVGLVMLYRHRRRVRTVSLSADNAYAFVADTATIVNTTASDLETVNAAVLEAITTDPGDIYGEPQFLTFDNDRSVAKTYTTAGDAEGYMYVMVIDNVVVGMQGIAGNIAEWETTFDAMFTTLTVAGASAIDVDNTNASSADSGGASVALTEPAPLSSTISLEEAQDSFEALTVAYPANRAAEVVIASSADVAGRNTV